MWQQTHTYTHTFAHKQASMQPGALKAYAHACTHTHTGWSERRIGPSGGEHNRQMKPTLKHSESPSFCSLSVSVSFSTHPTTCLWVSHFLGHSFPLSYFLYLSLFPFGPYFLSPFFFFVKQMCCYIKWCKCLWMFHNTSRRSFAFKDTTFR